MLQQFNEDIWFDEFDLFMPGGIHFRGRMTLIRIRSGELMMHSPIPISDELADEIAKIGEVQHIVAPCQFHHLHLPGAIERYPSARVYGAQGLDSKRKDINFDEMLSNKAPQAWADDFEQLTIEGVPHINEVVFFHKPTQTLLVTDLFFNIYEVANWRTKFLFRMVGAWMKPAQSKLWRMLAKDKKAAGNSVRQMLNWNFTTVLMAHGIPITENAKQEVEKALFWMLKFSSPKQIEA